MKEASNGEKSEDMQKSVLMRWIWKLYDPGKEPSHQETFIMTWKPETVLWPVWDPEATEQTGKGSCTDWGNSS